MSARRVGRAVGGHGYRALAVTTLGLQHRVGVGVGGVLLNRGLASPAPPSLATTSTTLETSGGGGGGGGQRLRSGCPGLTPVIRQPTRRCSGGAGARPTRVYNFGPGPGTLPDEVMLRAQAELLNYRGSGMGLLESTNLDASGASQPWVGG